MVENPKDNFPEESSVTEKKFKQYSSLEYLLNSVVDDVFNRKEVLLSIGGPPGSGKSTLLQIIHDDIQVFGNKVLVCTYEDAEKKALEEAGLIPDRHTRVSNEIRARANAILEENIDRALDEDWDRKRGKLILVEAPSFGYPDPDGTHDWGRTALSHMLENSRENVVYKLAYLFGDEGMYTKGAQLRDQKVQEKKSKVTDKKQGEYIEFQGAGARLVREFAELFLARSIKVAEDDPEHFRYVSDEHRRAAELKSFHPASMDVHMNVILWQLEQLNLPWPVEIVGHQTVFGKRENYEHPDPSIVLHPKRGGSQIPKR